MTATLIEHPPASNIMHARQRELARAQNRRDYARLENHAVALMKAAVRDEALGGVLGAVQIAEETVAELDHLDRRHEAYAEPIPDYLTDDDAEEPGESDAIANGGAWGGVPGARGAARWVPDVPAGVASWPR